METSEQNFCRQTGYACQGFVKAVEGFIDFHVFTEVEISKT